MVDLLPSGWKGFMLAGFAAAYMSTVGTHLNWGASYLVGDVYKRFLRKNESEKHYVAVSRWTTVGLFLASIVVTMNLSSIEGAWRFLLALGSGTGLVLILRWYWWRINAWSEISAMLTSMVVSLAAFAIVPKGTGPGAVFEQQATIMLVTVAVTTVVWVAVTFLTKPEPDATLDAFYLRVRPGGPGWETVSRRLGFGREAIPGGAMSFVNWFLGIVLVYTALFGIGKIVFGQLVPGFLLLAVAVVSFLLIMSSLKRQEKVEAGA
jgi:Na+/proline symporter